MPTTTKKKNATLTYKTINGHKYPMHHRNTDGVIVKSPAGKYVTQFGDMRDLPKQKAPAAKKTTTAKKTPAAKKKK